MSARHGNPEAPRRLAALLLAALLLLALPLAAGCQRDMVVLLPGPDGQVGRVVVATKAGSQELNQAYQGSVVTSADQAPSKPELVDKAKVEADFGQALAAQPAQPARFILYFDSGTTRLRPGSEALLPQVVRQAQARRSTDISVVGHSDTAGDHAYNMSLSTRRAQAVAKKLAELGLDPADMQITSHGENNPVVKTGDNAHEPRNRRVEVTVR